MRKLFAVAVAFALCAGAYADIGHYLADCYQPSVLGDEYWTCDLWATVSNGDDWTSSAAVATIDSGMFYEHPIGDDTPPLAALVGIYPELEYDSFYLSTKANPANQPPFADPSFAGVNVNEPQYRAVEAWFTTPPNGGVGDFLIARYTIHATDGLPVVFHVEGASTTFDGGGELYPFDLTCVIPEPASLALLGLGLALIRRR